MHKFNDSHETTIDISEIMMFWRSVESKAIKRGIFRKIAVEKTPTIIIAFKNGKTYQLQYESIETLMEDYRTLENK
jgi:hypothetical protein